MEYLRGNNIDKKALKNFEHLVVLRILYSLGYIAKKDKLGEVLQKTFVDRDILEQTQKERKNIVSAINRALKEAHL